MKKSAFIIILTVALYSCQKPKSFEYRDIKNIGVKQFGFNQTQLGMDLVYFNPNNFGVDLKHVDCDIYIDKTYLGKFLLDTTMHIDRKSEFSLPSKINVDMKNMFKNTLTVLFSREVLITVKGSTRVGKAGIFITFPVNYEARHKVDLFGGK